jgi:hypothetical protein
MAVILNASTSSGFIQTADTSGEIALQSNGTTELTVTSTGVSIADNLSFNSGYGSAAPAYGCRAWVNFNGTGTVAIRASGNVASVTDNGTGQYIINFTNAMPDASYSAQVTAQITNNSYTQVFMFGTNAPQTVDPTSGSFRFWVGNYNNASYDDSAIVCVAVFR